MRRLLAIAVCITLAFLAGCGSRDTYNVHRTSYKGTIDGGKGVGKKTVWITWVTKNTGEKLYGVDIEAVNAKVVPHLISGEYDHTGKCLDIFYTLHKDGPGSSMDYTVTPAKYWPSPVPEDRGKCPPALTEAQRRQYCKEFEQAVKAVQNKAHLVEDVDLPPPVNR